MTPSGNSSLEMRMKGLALWANNTRRYHKQLKKKGGGGTTSFYQEIELFLLNCITDSPRDHKENKQQGPIWKNYMKHFPVFSWLARKNKGRGGAGSKHRRETQAYKYLSKTTPKKHDNNASKQSTFDTEQKCTFLTATYIECNGINQDNGVLTKVIPLMFTLQK